MDNNTQTIEDLRAAIAEKAAARHAEVAGKIDLKKLQNEMAYIESDAFINDQIKQADLDILEAIMKPLRGISDKHFTMYQEFNYGPHVNIIVGATRSVVLQKQKGHKAVELAAYESAELSNFIELAAKHGSALIDAMGRNTYFDKLSGTVLEGTVGNANDAVAALNSFARALGLANFNSSLVTQERMNFLEEKAISKAMTQLEDNALTDPANIDEPAGDIVYATKTA